MYLLTLVLPQVPSPLLGHEVLLHVDVPLKELDIGLHVLFELDLGEGGDEEDGSENDEQSLAHFGFELVRIRAN